MRTKSPGSWTVACLTLVLLESIQAQTGSAFVHRGHILKTWTGALPSIGASDIVMQVASNGTSKYVVVFKTTNTIVSVADNAQGFSTFIDEAKLGLPGQQKLVGMDSYAYYLTPF